jgi:hypothetical protein
MSMSTGDVRRPSLNKLVNKAAATDKPDPDVIEDEESSPADSGSKATGGKATPAKSARPAKSAAAREIFLVLLRVVRQGDRDQDGCAYQWNRHQERPARGPSSRPVDPARAALSRPPWQGPQATAPIRVRSGVNWGPIAMFSIAGLLAVGIIAWGAVAVYKNEHKTPWQQRAAAIQGIHNYLASNPDWFKVPAEGNHKAGILTYPTNPPVGGIHNPTWQNCMGDVYDSQIAKEQATHSMEHGAVWITYRPDLPKDQVDALASKVRNQTFMLMSPYPGLDTPISLQAWGYQLKLDNANDKRIDQFIDALRINATQEPQAGCSGGITDATPTPLDMAPLPTA